MSQKSSYKRQAEQELILQEFRRALQHSNYYHASVLVECNPMIPLEAFIAVHKDEAPYLGWGEMPHI